MGEDANGLEIDWVRICARRLARHHLTSPAPAESAVEVVAAMGGVHAQVMSAAEVSIGIRTVGTTRQDVRRALWDERSLVKTFGPRGTVHLLASADLPLWTAALSVIPEGGSGLPKNARLSSAQTDDVVAAVADALDGSEPLTIEELSDAVLARLGGWAGDLVVPGFGGMWPRWRQALHTAGHRGVLCFGPDRGRKATYTSPADRFPLDRLPDPGEAVDEVLRRYLRTYGPAGPRDIAQWLAAPIGWISERFAGLTSELRPMADVDGWEGRFVLADDPATPTPAEEVGVVHLLPYFDTYAVGSHPRSRVYPGAAGERALSRGQAGTVPVLTVDGVVRGVWHQKRSGRRIAVTVEPFVRLTAGQRAAVEQRAIRVGEILEATGVSLTFGPVAVGKHL